MNGGAKISDQRFAALLNSPSESNGLEFKEAKNGYDLTKLCKYVVAIANERGGFIFLGVSDRPPRKVVGTKAFPNPSSLEMEVRSKTGLNIEAGELHHENGRVVVVKVPSRPTGTAYEFKGQYLMRSGEALSTMGEDRLRSIFAEGKLEWGLEVCLDQLSEQDVSSLLEIDTFSELWGHPPVENAQENIRRLVAARLLQDRGSTYGLTNAAAILLARDLDDFPDISRKAPRLIVYNGKDKLDTRYDVVGSRGYAAGFSNLIRRCVQNMPTNEVIRDALRETVPLFPEHALREIVANALIHQNFEVSGTGPTVEIYQNRIEVTNPGTPLLPVERFIDGQRSRNERLAFVMRQMKICEERSSGIDRVVRTAEAYQLPAPEFIEGYDSTLVIVHGHRAFQEMSQDDKVRACYQHCVLKFVVREAMTNDSLRERFGLPSDQNTVASRIIKATVDAGLVAIDPSVGSSRKYARYLPSWSVD